MKTNLNVDTQGLREKILDLAMRGKLVEQDSGDEPASILLERIKAEKAKLVKEGKIKKSKKLPEITDDEKPFDIPDNWEWVRLGDVASSITKGTTPKGGKNAYVSEGIKFFRAENVRNGQLSNKNVQYIPEIIHHNFLKRSILEDGDLLVTIAGSLGRVGIVSQDNIPGNVNQAISICRLVNRDTIFDKFLVYAISSVTSQLVNKKKVTSIPNLTLRQISEILFPLPPLNEQRRIADKVSELFRQVDAIEKNVAEFQDLEQAMRSKLLDLAMRGKLVEQDPSDEPASELVKQIQAEKAELVKKGKIKKSKKLPEITDDEKPFDIPDSWEWVRLGDINEYMGRSINPQEYGEEKFELYSVPVFKKNYPEILSGSEIKSSKQNVFFDDVLLCKINPRINRVWVVSNFTEFESIASSEWIVIRQPNVDSSFLKYCLSAPYFRAAIQENVSGVGGSLTRAKPAIVKELIIPLPPLAEQKRIADKLTRLFEDLDTIKQNLATVS